MPVTEWRARMKVAELVSMDFEAMWRALQPVGRMTTGGYRRAPFASAERECLDWFLEAAAARDLRIERDGNGNVVAWWEPAGSAGRAVVTGSHLDSVTEGGAYDGPLGVVSALAAIDLLRERGVRPDRPLGVSVFAEEEGSRFGLACLGSRLATGVLAPEKAAALTDREGVRLDEAMAEAGVEGALGRSAWLDRVDTFVELHVEQGRDLVHRERPVAVASEIWPHGRYRFDFTGEANHAGATRMEDRHDPMVTYAATALAAAERARLSGQRATFGRIEAVPNGTNAVPSRVTAWLDARAESDEVLAELVNGIETSGRARAALEGTGLAMTAESVSPAVRFDDALAQRLSAALADAPIIATQAGHDAGVLSDAGIPTAMLFVRNPTGVSHAPDEYAEMADCLAGVTALADVLEELAS